jgi:phosphonate transport system substrate-binding protein
MSKSVAPKLTFMNKKIYNLQNEFHRKTSLIENTIWYKSSIVSTENKITFKLHSIIQVFIALCLVITFAISISGCKQETKTKGLEYGKSSFEYKNTTYYFGIHPLYNPEMLMRTYQPLIDYLNKNIKGVEFVFESSRDYSNFEEKYINRHQGFLIPNPWQTLQAIKSGYTVIAMAGDPKDFKGILIVRKDGGISKPSDLKGKEVSYPSPTALAACIMPQYFFYKNGININKDIKNIFVGSQESSILNVFYKKTVAGATWPPPWRAFQKDHPNEASQLKVIWETESLVNNSVMVRDDVPKNIKDQVQKCLLTLDKTEDGKEILKNMETAYFKLATNKDYDVVKTYIKQFEKEVRKIDIK